MVQPAVLQQCFSTAFRAVLPASQTYVGVCSTLCARREHVCEALVWSKPVEIQRNRTASGGAAGTKYMARVRQVQGPNAGRSGKREPAQERR